MELNGRGDNKKIHLQRWIKFMKGGLVIFIFQIFPYIGHFSHNVNFNRSMMGLVLLNN